MSVPQAEAASGYTLQTVPHAGNSGRCYLVRPSVDSGLKKVVFLVEDGKIQRVDVGSPATTTLSGVGVSVDLGLLYQLYPGQIQDAADLTMDGTAVVFVPKDPADQDFRIVFDISDSRVSQYRAGLLPAVGYAQGCLQQQPRQMSRSTATAAVP
ncbi:MAG: hypothetical protein CSB46_07430 [Micrococcales bacterium]|nr:MAG: hypothetical protein CSB46_07430 [Micrococcales bacterium]